MVHFHVENHGTILLLRPLTDSAKDWVTEHIADDHQEFGGAVVVEHRYIADIMQGIVNDGMRYILY